jgi:hypothetical protein
MDMMASQVEEALALAQDELHALPRLLAGGKKRRTPEEQQQDLLAFRQNIGAIQKVLSTITPKVNPELDQKIQILIQEIRSRDSGILEGTAMTLAYNELPVEERDYWKGQETHRSMMQGLELLVQKASTPGSYAVHIMEFNESIVPTLQQEDIEGLQVHVQSLLRLAPNTQDLLEEMDGDKIKDTTGINCGKTIASGFNEAVKEMMPRESEAYKLCSQVNETLLARVMAACLERIQPPDDLSVELQRGIIARVLTQTIAGAAGDLSQVVPPQTYQLLTGTLMEIYTPAAVKEELANVIHTMKLDISNPETVERLNRMSGELGLDSMYDLLGDDFFEDNYVIPDAQVERIAQAGLLLVAGIAHDAPPPVGAPGPLVSPTALPKFPDALTDLIRLNWSVGEGTNLYFDKGTFTSQWGFFDEVGNTAARTIIKDALIGTGKRVLLTYMPPTDAEPHLQSLANAIGRQGPYTLGHAQEDFRRAQLTVLTAIESFTTEHLPIASL